MKKYIISGLMVVSLLATSAVAGAQVIMTPVNSSASSTTIAPLDNGMVPANCIGITNNLTLGSRDAKLAGEVTVLQNYLQSVGYFSGSATGYFGPITLKAVKAFQKANGVPPTGFVGVLTRAKLKLCNPNPVPTPVPSSSINITNPKGGEVLARGTTENIQWTDKNVYIQAAKYNITLSPKSPCEDRPGPCTLMEIAPYTIATGTTLSANGYSWNVADVTDTDRTVPDGFYRINVCPNGGSGNCARSNLFTISSGTTTANAPKVLSIAPNVAKVGDWVTIKGANYTSSNNTIHFGYGIIPNVNSTDGTTMTFQVPSQLNPACYYATPVHCMVVTLITPPAMYNISVTNANGTGNSLPLSVVTATTSVTTSTY